MSQGNENQSPSNRKHGGDVTKATRVGAPEVDTTVVDIVHNHGTEGFDNTVSDQDPYTYNSNQGSFPSEAGPQ